MGLWLRRAAAAGVRLVNVSPLRADMPDDVPAEWVPIRPGTDTALMLAMAHVLIAEGRLDQAFLDRCTTGFDRVRGYVLGEADAIAKTPDWAAAITAGLIGIAVAAESLTALSITLSGRPVP